MMRAEGLQQALEEIIERRSALQKELAKLDEMGATIRSWLDGESNAIAPIADSNAQVVSQPTNTPKTKSLAIQIREMLSGSGNPMKASALFQDAKRRGARVSNVNVVHACLNRYKDIFERTDEGWILKQ